MDMLGSNDVVIMNKVCIRAFRCSAVACRADSVCLLQPLAKGTFRQAATGRRYVAMQPLETDKHINRCCWHRPLTFPCPIAQGADATRSSKAPGEFWWGADAGAPG